MPGEIGVEKCLDLTTQLLLAAINSGKFSAGEGQATAEYFDKVYGQICECAGLTSEEYIRKYTLSKEADK